MGVAIILFLSIVLGLAYRATTPEERARLFQAARPYLQHAWHAAAHSRGECEPFYEALRARTAWASVTPVLVVLNVTIFVCILFGTRAFSDAEALIGWGGNFGLRTTNGEWWRLVTATFIHVGVLSLLVNIFGLAQLGLILERFVGSVTFAAVFTAAGTLASLVSLTTHPVAVSVGASGAIFGLYGLLLALLISGMLFRPTVTIPLAALKRLAPAAVVFVVYNVTVGSLEGRSEIVGLATGFVCGLVLTMGVRDRKPPAHRVAEVVAATVVVAVAAALPLRGLEDARPAIEQVVAFENRTGAAYEIAVNRFKTGRVQVEALTGLIDQTIMPELQEARIRVEALDRVPHEHQPLVAGAEEYLRLRDESWRLRAEGLNKANMRTLQKADLKEREALKALEKIRPTAQK